MKVLKSVPTQQCDLRYESKSKIFLTKRILVLTICTIKVKIKIMLNFNPGSNRTEIWIKIIPLLLSSFKYLLNIEIAMT